jgi:hypothetical protein
MPLRNALLASAILAVADSGPATASGIRYGQFSVGGIQNICLKSDGTWYGITFNFNGHWTNNPGGGDRAAI